MPSFHAASTAFCATGRAYPRFTSALITSSATGPIDETDAACGAPAMSSSLSFSSRTTRSAVFFPMPGMRVSVAWSLARMAATSRAALIAARNAVVLRQNALKNLLSDRYGDWKDVDLEPGDKLSEVPPVLDRQDSWSKGLTLRPDLLQAKLSVEKNNITLRYNKNQLYPELDVVGSYGRNGTGGLNGSLWGSLGGIRDAAGEQYSYGFALTIPLSNRTAKNNYRTAKAQVEQSLLQLKQLEQTIMVNIENDIAQARSSYEQVQATKEAVEFAIAALDAEKKKLDNGKSTSF